MSRDHDGGEQHAPPWTTWAISAVNGLVGDYLYQRGNGLAINMAFYHRNRPFAPARMALQTLYPNATGRICLLIHGLGCHEGVWFFRETGEDATVTSYGELLRRDLGFTPFYIRYNTGMSIVENGRRLAGLITELVLHYPIPVEEIVLIGHSMGGLIIRTACYAGAERQADWVRRVTRAFYLGTPHDGAMLAQLSDIAAATLQIIPNPITRLVGEVFDIRSRGIRDLSSGAVHDSERRLPWLASAHHYMIVGTLTHDPAHLASALFGDGLVHPPGPGSAMHDPPPTRGDVKVFPRMHHLQLAHEGRVYQQIRHWCNEP